MRRNAVLIALAATVLLAACSSDDTTSSATTTSQPTTVAPPTPERTTGTTAADGYADGVRPGVEPVGTVAHASLTMPDGTERTYRLYLPSTFDPQVPTPLLVALHGGLGWGDQFAETNHVEGLAEANGFVVVHPDGARIRPRLPSGTWNGGYCCGPAAADQVDDVAFVSAVLDAVGQKVTIDPARTFAMGHSNGGIMSYRLACELGDRIVGIGVVGASLGVDTCTPPAAVSLIHIHGLADVNHPIDGGPGEGVADVEFRPARDGVETLVAVDGCDASTTATDGDVTTETWTGCATDSAVAFVRIAGASHAWPGGTPGRSVSGPTYEGYDATAAIWAFLMAHPRR